MRTIVRLWRRIAIVGAALALLGGCALTTDTVQLNYDADKNVAPVTEAAQTRVVIALTDSRPAPKNKVSFKVNGFGSEMAPIEAANEPGAVVSKAIEDELRNRGFQLASGGVAVAVELSNFFSTFHAGFTSATADAVVFLNITVKGADGSVAYNRAITGHKLLEGIVLMTGSNAKIALDAALKDAISQLMSDTAFVPAIVKAGGAMAPKPSAELSSGASAS